MVAGFANLTSVDYQMADARARDAERERDEALAALEDRNHRDRDETRRLLYGALAAGRTARWELVGTLVNALVHHSGLETDPYELLDYLCVLVETEVPLTADDAGAGRIRDLIAKLDVEE